MTDSLFPGLADPPVVESLSAQRRLTARQKADVEHGRHPLTRGRLSAVNGATCGGCRFRMSFSGGNRSYPKCTVGAPDGKPYQGPRVSKSVHSDVRAWWPGCVDYEPNERSDSDG